MRRGVEAKSIDFWRSDCKPFLPSPGTRQRSTALRGRIEAKAILILEERHKKYLEVGIVNQHKTDICYYEESQNIFPTKYLSNIQGIIDCHGVGEEMEL